MATPLLPFIKMHGIGNDYVYLDAVAGLPVAETALPELARAMSSRHFGVGSDGLILIRPATVGGARYRMQMFNSDGSESEMCGNGLRCVAKFLADSGYEKGKVFPIQTGAGVLEVTVTRKTDPATGSKVVSLVRVNMGEPRLLRRDIPMSGAQDQRALGVDLVAYDRIFKVTALSMGNPHCVVFCDTEPDDALVHRYGPLLENHDFFPRRANIEFVHVQSKKRIKQRTWERGAGETLACGTGASAVCVAGVLNGLTGREVEIELLGGTLKLEWNEEDNCVYKTGPAEEVFRGEWPLRLS